MNAIIIGLAALVFTFVLSAFPLHFSVKLLKGQTDFFKTLLVVVISGIIVAAVQYRFKFFGGFIAFAILIWLYHEVFRLKWWKAFLAWILQFVFVIIFYAILAFIAAAFIGLSLMNVI